MPYQGNAGAQGGLSKGPANQYKFSGTGPPSGGLGSWQGSKGRMPGGIGKPGNPYGGGGLGNKPGIGSYGGGGLARKPMREGSRG